MINLLPPAIKQEMRYSRYNAVIIRYVRLAVFVTLVLAGALLGGRYYLDQQVKQTNARIAEKQQQVEQYTKLEASAKKLSERVGSIQKLQKSQSRFSVLLSDLAQYMPQGAAISSITLTGDDKHPVRMTVKSMDYKTALGVRDGIIKSKRISAADIENIQGPDKPGDPYTTILTFGFNVGAAK
jgi:hypothetical protein